MSHEQELQIFRRDEPLVRVRFKLAYTVRARHTCCFSGWKTYGRQEVAAGEVLRCHCVQPSKRRDYTGRKLEDSPQFSDITLVGSLHPVVLCEVPNDVFEVLET